MGDQKLVITLNKDEMGILRPVSLEFGGKALPVQAFSIVFDKPDEIGHVDIRVSIHRAEIVITEV